MLIAHSKEDVIKIGGVWINLCPHGYTLDCCNGGCASIRRVSSYCDAVHEMTDTVCVIRHTSTTGDKHGGFFQGTFVRWEVRNGVLVSAGKNPEIIWPTPNDPAWDFWGNKNELMQRHLKE